MIKVRSLSSGARMIQGFATFWCKALNDVMSTWSTFDWRPCLARVKLRRFSDDKLPWQSCKVGIHSFTPLKYGWLSWRLLKNAKMLFTRLHAYICTVMFKNLVFLILPSYFSKSVYRHAIDVTSKIFTALINVFRNVPRTMVARTQTRLRGSNKCSIRNGISFPSQSPKGRFYDFAEKWICCRAHIWEVQYTQRWRRRLRRECSWMNSL